MFVFIFKSITLLGNEGRCFYLISKFFEVNYVAILNNMLCSFAQSFPRVSEIHAPLWEGHMQMQNKEINYGGSTKKDVILFYGLIPPSRKSHH